MDNTSINNNIDSNNKLLKELSSTEGSIDTVLNDITMFVGAADNQRREVGSQSIYYNTNQCIKDKAEKIRKETLKEFKDTGVVKKEYGDLDILYLPTKKNKVYTIIAFDDYKELESKEKTIEETAETYAKMLKSQQNN